MAKIQQRMLGSPASSSDSDPSPAFPAGDPEPVSLAWVGPTQVRWGRRVLTYFGGSDYFRLSWHPEVRARFVKAARNYGHNVAASRITTGNHALYGQMETKLADWLGFASAVLVPNGYAAPLIAAQCLEGRITHVLVPESAHGCLKDAAQLTSLPVLPFEAGNLLGLRKAIRSLGKGARVGLWTEGLSPQRAVVAALTEYLRCLPRTGWMLVDDAHGVGTLGGKGRGALDWEKVRDPRVILAGTLSKAMGCQGGFVAGPQWIREAAFHRSRMFTGSTPVGLPYVEALRVALGLMKKLGPARRQRLERFAQQVRSALADCADASADTRASDVAGVGPVITWVPPSEREQKQLSSRLLELGIYPSLIRYPGGPAKAFFRFALSSEHSKVEVDRLCQALKSLGQGFQ